MQPIVEVGFDRNLPVVHGVTPCAGARPAYSGLRRRAMSNPSAPSPATPDAAAPVSGVIDAGALATLRSLDPSGKARLLERVLAAFETSLARLQPQLAAARRDGDAEAAKQVAHTLKSSSATVGAIKLSRLCAEMEAMIRNGDCPDLDAGVEALDAEIAAVLPALRNLLRSSP